MELETPNAPVLVTHGCELDRAQGRLVVPDLTLRGGEAALIEVPRAEADHDSASASDHDHGSADDVCEVLLGLAPAASGEVWLFGESILVATRARQILLRRRVATAPERPAFLSTVTVPDNVALPLRDRLDPPGDESMARTTALLATFGIELRGRVLPAQLTHEARYLAGFARALLTEPELLIVCAPQSNLAPNLALAWRDALATQLGRGAAVLVLGGARERRVLPFEWTLRATSLRPTTDVRQPNRVESR